MWRIQCGPYFGLRTFSRQSAGSRAPRASVLLICALLTACGLGDSEETAQLGLVEGFAGLVAADDPRATVVGRDILGGGGNAADAAAAMYFTLAVTLPSRAGLGGGGVCVLFDSSERNGELIDFLPRRSGSGLAPLGVRAMAALHARHGRQRWEEIVGAAENLARFGHGVSRAFARDLAYAEPLLRGDSELARSFRTAAGTVPTEGDRLVQGTLATVLGGIRAQGASYVHSGPFAERFVDATLAAGLPIEMADLRQSVPRVSEALAVKVGNDMAYFTGPPAGGILAAQLWRVLTDEADYRGADGADRGHLFAEAAMRAFAGRRSWLGSPAADGSEAGAALVEVARIQALLADYDPARHTPAGNLMPAPAAVIEDSAGAGFAAADRFGNAVACSLTMNGLFGSGRMAPGTGILLAAPPTSGNDGALSPAAVVIGNPANGDFRFAAAASGGAAAPTALVQVMLGVLEDGVSLDEAMRAARFHHGGLPDELFYESGVPEAVASELLSRGHAMQEAAALGQVEALYCPRGIHDASADCVVASDPRGYGLAARAQ
jgi:gamma-glutamyltranspeptidase/glutathione hydrolase